MRAWAFKYLDGRLYRGAKDGHVFALEAESRKTVWDISIAGPARGESVPMAPVAWSGRVFVGNAGGNNIGVTGRVYALDAAAPGKQLWRFDTVPDPATVAATWRKKSAGNPPAGGALFAPGERTEKFRLGAEQLPVSANGESQILMEDYASALADGLEALRHSRQRFTVGY